MNKTKNSLKIMATLLCLSFTAQSVSANVVNTHVVPTQNNVQAKERHLVPIEQSFDALKQQSVIHEFDDLVLSSNAVPHTKKSHTKVKKNSKKAIHKKARCGVQKSRKHVVATEVVDTPLVEMNNPQAWIKPEPNVIDVRTETTREKVIVEQPIVRETTVTNVTNPVYLNSNGVEVKEISATPVPVMQQQKAVTNKFSVGAGVSHKKTDVGNVYGVKGNPNYKVFVENETKINPNEHFSHVIKLGGNVDYNRKTADVLGEKVKHAGQLDYGVNVHYSPEFKVNNAGSVYPIFGVGMEHTQIGKHNTKKLQTERDYVDVGLGASANLSPYQKVFLEGKYAQDFRVKHKDQYDPAVTQQTVKGNKGKQYTVEMGVKSKFNQSGQGYSVSMYHSEYKNKNGHNLMVNGYPMQVGKTKQTENGVKMSVDF